MQPLISIIIPTKDRYNTLIPVIESINSFLTPKIELVIQDNSEDNSLIIGNRLLKNDSVKYFYKKEPIPISDNTTLAIDNSTGKYIVFIGDDDFVSPKLLSIVENLDENGIECLIYNAGYYWWDSVSFVSNDYYRNNLVLTLPRNISTDMKKLSSSVELKKVLDNGAVGYYYLPRFYHGIVKKDCLMKIKDSTGKYLNGSCPDMAFAVSLSMVMKEYYFMNYPVTIFGASKNSGGGLTANKSHYMKIEDATFLRKDILEKWDAKIPRIWSQKTIYPQTAREVLDSFGRKDLKINYLSFYSSMLVYEPYLKKYLLPLVKKELPNLKSRILFIKSVFRRISGLLLLQIRTKLHIKNLKVFKHIKPEQINNVLRSV